jgi:CheY-like chemotaxis protein
VKKLSDCRVLLVDDAKANLDILVEGLKPDYKLSLALNGEMALQIAARTPPDQSPAHFQPGCVAACQSANALHPIKPTTTVRFPRDLFQYL